MADAGHTDIAWEMFEDSLYVTKGEWKKVNSFIDSIVFDTRGADKIETIDYVENSLLPQLKSYSDGMILDEIEVWENDLAEYRRRKEAIIQEDLQTQREEQEEREAQRQLEYKKREEQIRLERQKKEAEISADNKIYIYCGVMLPFSSRPYSYRTEDETLKIGDSVIVAVGSDNKEIQGTVISVGQYMRAAVPYPVDKSKFILRKV